MTDKQKPDGATNSTGLNFVNGSNGYDGKNTDFPNETQIAPDGSYFSTVVIWSMQKAFVKNGGSLLPDCKLLQSKFLREVSGLCLDGNGCVWQPKADTYGNYHILKFITPQMLVRGFERIREDKSEFYDFVQKHPELLKLFKEYYD